MIQKDNRYVSAPYVLVAGIWELLSIFNKKKVCKFSNRTTFTIDSIVTPWHAKRVWYTYVEAKLIWIQEAYIWLCQHGLTKTEPILAKIKQQ
jgi:hypothetical protein